MVGPVADQIEQGLEVIGGQEPPALTNLLKQRVEKRGSGFDSRKDELITCGKILTTNSGRQLLHYC